MADPQPGRWDIDVDDGLSGSKDRATVALVSEQVKGVERLIDIGFKDVQRQLDSVSGLPERVTRLEVQIEGLQRIAASDGQRKADKITWKRGAITAGCLMLLGTLVNLAISGHIF